MGRRTMQGWPVHGSTMDLTVADGRGSLELGLTVVLVRGGLPRGWQGEGGNIARPGEEVVHRRRDFGFKRLWRGHE
jgi:hypothetical protein